MHEATTPAARRRLAVVLFQLGGPDSLAAVKPFLFNLFNDPAILRVPAPIRPLLAWLVSRRRLRPALENYAHLGGRSPLLDLTQSQARALEAALCDAETEVRCVVAMRYWHPFTGEALRVVQDFAPDEVVLLPLYPQFSTTTTGSSSAAWWRAAEAAGLAVPTRTLCCFHSDGAYAAAQAALVAKALAEAEAACAPGVAVRLLFSAHGLPEGIVRDGDPYQWQVEQTVRAVLRALGRRDLAHTICYQSRATPQRWIGPSTPEAIHAAGAAGEAVVVVPIAFVSEHSETLVELDVEYRAEAERCGVRGYFRVPAPGTDPAFIAALAGLVGRLRARGGCFELRRPRAVPGGPPLLPAPRGSGVMELLADLYPWIKTLHVISVIAWMAGLLYLPRLFVYHAASAPFSEASERFKLQERRLLRAIMNPAMVLVWITGTMLAVIPGLVAWDMAWPWLKGLGILILSVIHHVYGYWRKSLAAERRRPAWHYRLANEVPTVAMILIVTMIIARPF